MTKQHISYSELKIFTECPYKWHLQYEKGLAGFTGNIYTAFGTAIHSVCEQSALGNLTEAEELILEIAESREISPSDPEIQARLEVGRPRLSQLYNSLYKSGILSVRKKGRTRFFKLTENAVEYLSKE